MYDVIDEAGNAQHDATTNFDEAVQSCNELNKLNLKRKDGGPKQFFVTQRLIRHPREFATVVKAAAPVANPTI